MERVHPRMVDLVGATVDAARAGKAPRMDAEGKVPAAHYLDPARTRAEVDALFTRLPIPLACSGELASPGATIVRELGGVSVLLVRGQDGAARGFRNSCRHRGTRLVREDGPRKAFVCPYHAWTYELDGRLRHVPCADAFPSLDPSCHGLAPIQVEERHGLVWARLSAGGGDVRSWLGALDEELAALSLETHVLARRVEREQEGNWKLLMEAFLEGYHVRILHKTTVGPFFVDTAGIAERAGVHIRHATPRRAAVETNDPPSLPVRELATFGYSIFPCTVLIAHPDWISHVVVQPRGPNRFLWCHSQLVPNSPERPDAETHFRRSFDLIEGAVFQKEDLFVIGEIQAGLATGANRELTFGRLESAILWFHEAVDAALSGLE
jgi:phenylpropionate dioxygenase-like ring-hydroxylating dioxygenase large terminal subunit